MNLSDKKIAGKNLILVSLPFFIPSLLTALKGAGDKISMAFYIGVEELAAYNILLQIGFLPMMLFIGVIQTYLSPQIYKLTAVENLNRKEVISYLGKVVFKILILASIMIIASDVLSELIFGILVGVEYLNYSKFLPYFVLAGAFSGISSLLNIGIIGALKSRSVGILMSISILSGLLIFIVFIEGFGFEGGIAGLVFSNMVMMTIFGGALVKYKIIN
jgi:O-antigen/teichoic acid export membrane protein